LATNLSIKKLNQFVHPRQLAGNPRLYAQFGLLQYSIAYSETASQRGEFHVVDSVL